ncbi:MAG: hypothetical protein ABJB47_17030 [Actinomycetota bacterium]
MAGGRLIAGSRLLTAVICGRVGVIVLTLAVVTAGCGGSKPVQDIAGPSASVSASQSLTRCGTTKTAANVPVQVEVHRGGVPCGVAMGIERAYATAIEAGQEPGNGGGGPVQVKGWTCRGFTTPVVLRTGNASKCVKGKAEILAVLPTPA